MSRLTDPGPLAIRVAAMLLGAACVAWAATPPVHNGLVGVALPLAIIGVAAGALRLALSEMPVPEDAFLLGGPQRIWLWFLEALRKVPWEEGGAVAVLWLEVLHSARPRHTAILGAALVAYLLTIHLAESDAALAALRPQVRVLALGAVLLALGAAAGMLPASGPGAGSALPRVISAVALIVAGGLVLPHVAAGPPSRRE